MGRERILVDTSFLVAWLNKKDIHHKKAFQVKNELGSKAVLVITDVVVNETLSVLARRAQEGKLSFHEASQKLLSLVPSPAKFYFYTFSDWNEIISLVLKSNGQLNFHDALLIIGAKKEGITTILSFDSDFDGYLQRKP